MISWKLALGCVLLLSSSAKISAFDAQDCDAYVFRTQENALWHCGDKIPEEPSIQWGDQWMGAWYCDHSMGEEGDKPWAWASKHPDDWCDFMIATVRGDNEDHYPLTEKIGLAETPGPNQWEFSAMVDWGCYMVDNGEVTASYLVDSKNGKHASTTTEQCKRTPEENNYFDEWSLDQAIRHTKVFGHLTNKTYTPVKHTTGAFCHYDNVEKASIYAADLEVQYAECEPGYVCEYKSRGVALCMPDPKADHECCVSWHNVCQNKGECCAGSECSDDGYCDPSIPQEEEDPEGTCTDRAPKEDRSLWSYCKDFDSEDRGDCAEGYKCVGNNWWANCEVDESVKNDHCKWKFEADARPGDCCLGWMHHCNEVDPDTGECLQSQCVAGRETGSENGVSYLDVHDRMLTDPPKTASFNERISRCTGAVCGVWGDPHIITCDDLHYDCQAVGTFTLMKNHMFNIQANFVHIDTPWGGASVTNDIAIDFVKDAPNNVPRIQFSFPHFDASDQKYINDDRSRQIGSCPVMMFIDGDMINISEVLDGGYLYEDKTTETSVKLDDYDAESNPYQNKIVISQKAGVDANEEPYYSDSIIWIEGGGLNTAWSCIFTYFICLPGEDEAAFRDYSVGLLGTPTGRTNDDWMGDDGQTLMIPTTDRTKASFNYCVDNWCVDEPEFILAYPPGASLEHFKCEDQEFFDFDIDKCQDSAAIIEACSGSQQPIACQMEKCIGNPNPETEIENIANVTKFGDDEDDKDNFLENPEVETQDEYGDCTNLGSGTSGSTGTGAWSGEYPAIDCIVGKEYFSIGYDNSVSVLVGGSFNCKNGYGFEGRGVFMGDMTIDLEGCSNMAATGHGSLIHPMENSVCIEVGGEVSIETDFTHTKEIMYQDGNINKACHFAYKGGCTLNGEVCPHSLSDLENQGVYTNGDFAQKSDMDLSIWADQLTLLRKKTEYWSSLDANGSARLSNDEKHLFLEPGTDNNAVQVFELDTISSSTEVIFFSKSMHDKTILINVNGDGDFFVPMFCYHPRDENRNDQYICGRSSFPTDLTASIVWVFTGTGSVHIKGSNPDDANEMHGSIVKATGPLTFSADGHAGRLIVGGDLTIDGIQTELFNYEFDPSSQPLPLGDDLSEVCEIDPPPVCVESYKVLTGDTVCPSNPDGIVKLISSSAEIPDNEPILYDIIIEPPIDTESSHTVKFKIDSPFTNYTDIYIKHVKKVGKYAMDPTCESMPFTAGCSINAPIIEVGCHEYDGVNPFALVNIYFASNTDSVVMDIGSGNDVTIDKCCEPPAEYDTGYGLVQYTFEIQCTCPDGVANQ